MFSIELECDPEQKDVLIADLWDAGCCGITELSDTRVRGFFEQDPAGLLSEFSAYNPRLRTEEERDWVQEVRDSWKPLTVGEMFYLVPEWMDDPAPPGRMRIVINPGLAFGTGTHEATQLCMEALERHVRPYCVVADIGTGSGILSVAARLLGATFVIACDVDPDAVEVAHRRAPEVAFFTGSVDALATASADVVVANISPEAIVALAPEILRVLKPGGIALTSGFENYESAEVRRHVEGTGGRAIEERQKNNWSFLAFEHR